MHLNRELSRAAIAGTLICVGTATAFAQVDNAPAGAGSQQSGMAAGGEALGEATGRNGAMSGNTSRQGTSATGQSRIGGNLNQQPPIDSNYGAQIDTPNTGASINRRRRDGQTPSKATPHSQRQTGAGAINRYQSPSTNTDETRIDSDSQ